MESSLKKHYLKSLVVRVLPYRQRRLYCPTQGMATTQEDAPQALARNYKNPHQLEQLRFTLARLSYRDEQQDWQDVPESYTSWDDKSRYEKPWNVEQVYFTPNGA